jgi:hypothetical protein
MSEKSALQATADVINPEVLPRSVAVALPPQEQGSLPEVLRNRLIQLERELDPIALFEQQANLLTKLRPQAIALTTPQDWIQMGDKVYLQATGCERFAALYGLVFEKPQITRENEPDGTYTFEVTIEVFSRVTKQYFTCVGGRHSGEKFFQRTDDEGNAVPPNPVDVRKAAVTNAMNRAVSMIAGLRNLTAADLAASGKKAGTNFKFKTGKEGGGAAAVNDDGEVVIPFGKNKGIALTDLSDNSLEWYVKNARKNLESEEFQKGGKRFKYRAKEERFLEDLEGEVFRRVEAMKNADGGSDEPQEVEPDA